MSTTTCTFCSGDLLLQIDDETIICPAHPELHDSDGRPQFTVADIQSGGITISEPVPIGVTGPLVMVAAVILWGVIVLTVMNPVAGFFTLAAVIFVGYAAFGRTL